MLTRLWQKMAGGPSPSKRAGRPGELISVRPNVERLEAREIPAVNLVNVPATPAVGQQFAATTPATEPIAISADGRYVVFASTAKNLLANPPANINGSNLYWRDTIAGQTKIITVLNNGLAANDADPNLSVVISDDGQFVAFLSKTFATNYDPTITALDDSTSIDLFRWSAASGAVQLVSVANFFTAASGLFSPTAVGNLGGTVTTPDISADGQFVSFASSLDAGQIVTANVGNKSAIDETKSIFADLFRRDMNKGVSVLVSATPGGVAVGQTADVEAVDGRYMSGDGQFFVYSTTVNANGITGTGTKDSNNSFDVFRRDMNGAGSTVVVSVTAADPNVTAAANDKRTTVFSRFGLIARNNPNAVVFLSNAAATTGQPTELVTGYANGTGNIDSPDLYFRNVALGKTLLVNVAANSANVSGNSGVVAGSYSIDDAGTTVVYSSASNNLAPGVLDVNGVVDVFARRLATGTTIAVSVVPSGKLTASIGGTTGNDFDGISPNGRFVAFTSLSSDLVSGSQTDLNNLQDVFFRDLQNNSTTLVSTRFGDNFSANNASSFPRIGNPSTFANEPSIVFQSLATDMLPPTPIVPSAANPALPQPSGGNDVYINNRVAGTPLGGFSASIGLNKAASVFTFNTKGQAILNGTFQPFADLTNFFGEIRSTVADVNGDGVLDLIAGTGPGTVATVRIYSGADGKLIGDFQPFGVSYTGGVYVAAGDVVDLFDDAGKAFVTPAQFVAGKDGFADIIVGSDEGSVISGLASDPNSAVVSIAGNSQVRVFSIDAKNFTTTGNTLTPQNRFVAISGFTPYERSFSGGIRVATGDVNGDGLLDIITGAGFGGGPRVSVFSGINIQGNVVLADFFAYENTQRDGVYVAAGDINGDGFADLITGAGPGGGPRVRIFDGGPVTPFAVPGAPVSNGQPSPRTIADFFAFEDINLRGGVRVAATDLDGSGLSGVVVGSGFGGSSRIRTYLPIDLLNSTFPPSSSDFFLTDPGLFPAVGVQVG